MTTEVENQTSQLLTELKGFVKQYIKLDAQGRSAEVYTAAANAIAGSRCSVTKYGYAGPASTAIITRKEVMGIWNPTNDIAWETYAVPV